MRGSPATRTSSRGPPAPSPSLGNNGERLRSWEFEGVFAVRWSGPTLSADVADSLTETLEVAHNGFRAKTL